MLAPLRTAAARRAIASTGRATARRTHSHDAHAHATHSPEVHQHEGFGKGYFISIAVLVGTVVAYRLDTSSSGTPLITRIINKYHSNEAVWEAQTVVRTQFFERAAADRSLFQDSGRNRAVSVKNVESFNSGSPYNQEAGWSHGTELGTVKAHLEALREKHSAAFEK